MHSCSILVVEDDENVRALVSTLAGKYADQVDVAADGVIALEQLRKRRYDIVVLDLMLPRINGVEVADEIAKMFPRPKVIVLSAVARYFADHFPDDVTVMQKPFDLHVLDNLLRVHSDATIPRDATR